MNKKYILLLLIVANLLVSSCGELTLSDGKDWVPKEFHPRTDILLIEQYPNKEVNERMLKYLSKEYRGKYEVVERNEILNKTNKYSDIELYKFGFLWETNKRDNKLAGHFFNRSTGYNYPLTSKNNRYQSKNAFKAYLSTINLFYKRK